MLVSNSMPGNRTPIPNYQKSFKSNSINKIFEQGLNDAIKRSKEISNEY